MSRPLRIEFPGALYHVTSRGDGREAVYLDEQDRTAFLAILAQVCEHVRWVCHAYCLMTNHYHLLVETPEAKLAVGMRRLNGVYTQRFNRRHHHVGHVYQGRYTAILVQKDDHLLELSRYIVLNPVRAGIVRAAREWPWSSYRATAGLAEPPRWLHTAWLLAEFGSDRRGATTSYRQFVCAGRRQPSPWQDLKQQLYFGDEHFVEHTQARIGDAAVLTEVPAPQRRPIPAPLDRYQSAVLGRNQAIVAAYRSGEYSMRVIADHFGVHYSRISQIVRGTEGSRFKT